MKFATALLSIFLFYSATVTLADQRDYLALMAADSEIKAIAVVKSIKDVSHNGDGTFKHITFKTIHGVTSLTPTTFVAGCKTLESRWQKRLPGTVYFNPRVGQKVYVTASTDGGAITSYTLLTPELNTVLRKSPYHIEYHRGKAYIMPME